MRKFFNRICVMTIILVMLSLTACGNESSKGENKANESVKYDNTTLEGILEGAEEDFDATMEYLKKDLDEVYEAMGGTYKGYIENKQKLYDWYDLIVEESKALFGRTETKSIEYYKLVASTIDPSKEGTMTDALKDFYDTVLEKGYSKYYEEVCDDMMDFVYGEIYEEIVEEAEGSVSEEEWEREDKECYERLESAQEGIMNLCYDEVELQVEIWYEVGDAFGYDKNFDVDTIVEKCKAEYLKEQNSEMVEDEMEEEPSEEFVEIMDAYEEFFEEYVDFINEYNATEDVSSMLAEYTQIMEEYATVMQEISELDSSEMSAADALYYSEVMLRISEKMMEIEY